MKKNSSVNALVGNNILSQDNNFKLLLNTLPDLIWVKDADGFYLYCNHEFELFFGAKEADILGKTDYDFVNTELADFFRENDLAALQNGSASVNEEWVSYAGIKKSVYLKTTKTPLHDAKGELIGILGIGHDITYLKETEANLRFANGQLSQLASTDGLTQIPNRRAFDAHLAQQWRFCQREQVPLALLLIDVDFFKEYNDCYGHVDGDKCLQKVGELLISGGYANRPNDFFARFGGEEFAVILSATNANFAFEIAEKFRVDAYKLNIEHAHSKVEGINDQHVTVSIGVASMIPQQDNGHEALLQCADKALYRAKAEGRNISVKCEHAN